MKINGVELKLDLYDLEAADRVRSALYNLSEGLDGIEKKNVDWCESFHEQMQVICRFFDEIFGKGTSLYLFGKKRSLKTAYEAIDDFFKAFQELQNQVEPLLKGG